MIAAPCTLCGHVHTKADAVAVGRFSGSGVSAYRAALTPTSPPRATREEAIADACSERIRRS